jgi:hypothetical protein
MENFEIQNHLGEVIVESISKTELDALIEAAQSTGEHNYFEYDATEEYDLVKRFAKEKEEDALFNLEVFRIFKRIG